MESASGQAWHFTDRQLGKSNLLDKFPENTPASDGKTQTGCRNPEFLPSWH